MRRIFNESLSCGMAIYYMTQPRLNIEYNSTCASSLELDPYFHKITIMLKLTKQTFLSYYKIIRKYKLVCTYTSHQQTSIIYGV